MKRLLLATITLLVLFSSPIIAKDIEFDPVAWGTLTQSDFADFITEFGTAIAFRPMAPADTLGIVGFDIGAEVVATDIRSSKNYWELLTEDNDPWSYLPIPRVHVQKGLPFQVDVGGMYVKVPDSNIELWGVEVKKGIIKGGLAMPAVCARVAYSKLEGVDDINLSTIAAELMISKGFLLATPYAGVEYLHIEGSEEDDVVTGFSDVEEDLIQFFAGCELYPFPFLNITLEASLGEIPSYGLKGGIRF